MVLILFFIIIVVFWDYLGETDKIYIEKCFLFWMKGVFVILDGVADEPCEALGGKTPLEAARTPNLDDFARKSKLDYCYPVNELIVPESSSAIVSLLGQDPSNAPRGPLEAMGLGIKINKGDLVLRINFATIDSLDKGNILDSRAGRTLTTKEAEILAKAVNENVKIPYKFELYPGIGHRGVLIFRGGFSDNITNADPFYGEGSAKSSVNPRVVYSKPMDDEDESKHSADMLNMFLRHSHEVLEKHPLNIERRKKGLFAANFILARDAGNEPIKLKKMKGKWMALGYMPLEKGIATAAGMQLYSFRYPKLKGIDVYDNLFSGLKKATKYACRMIKRNKSKADYFYVHFKETDTPGHDNKPLEKMKMVELIDERFFGFLKKYMDDVKIVVTADHTTACRKKAHSKEPVPVLTYNFTKGREGQRFIEGDGLKGKKIIGRKLLDETLFKK